MNLRLLINNLGKTLLLLAACMLPSLLVALLYGDRTIPAFLLVMAGCVGVGLPLLRVPLRQSRLFPRDGLAITAFAWLTFSAIGALPFVLTGAIPSYIDAFFETVSGFTTTGSTILTQIEALPHSILFWRSFTHWIGGMGVLVLLLAILPSVQGTSLHIMRAESTGPQPGKVAPRMSDTARILWRIYLTLSLLMFLALLLAGMPLFDSFIHVFGTAGTGGFSNHSESIGYFNSTRITVIVSFFTLLFGVNLSLYLLVAKRDFKSFVKDEELRFYTTVVFVAIALITADLYREGIFTSFAESLTHAGFQVTTIISTTGFSSTDFDLWPTFSKTLLLILMFIGSSAGSTAGGIKCIRFVILGRILRREFMRTTHPRSVQTIRFNGHIVEESIVREVANFFALYLFSFTAGLILISLDGKDLVTTISSVAATLNNVGPGLQLVGPTASYAHFTARSKIVFSALMLLGRLEIYPILLLLFPSVWKKHS